MDEQFGPGVLLNVGSGGTDVCTGIVQGSPLQPVWAGEISGPCLGVAATAYDEHGHGSIDELGELVITQPMPSMPVGFWGDDDGTRYRAAYFDTYPGVWRHGDWVRFTATGSCTITGRSDATLNRGGVRLGTAEFYRVVEELPEVDDSLVVHLEDPTGGAGELILFVVTATTAPSWTTPCAARSPRAADAALPAACARQHHPRAGDPEQPHRQELELPAKKILLGAAPSEVVSRDTLTEPTSLDTFTALAAQRPAH